MPTMLSTAAQTRTHPSADVPVPADVIDVLLWRTAFDVAAEHQRGPTGDCTNLRCTGQRGTCTPATQAQQALRLARQPPAPKPRLSASTPLVARPAPTHAQAPVQATARGLPPAPTVTGRATVGRPNTGRFTGWFASAVGAVNGRRSYQLPRREPGAALTLAAA